jgi:hypothetical protein
VYITIEGQPDRRPGRRKPNPKKPTKAKEMTMTSLASTFCRTLTCAAAAALISLLVAMSFVQSTSVPPGARAAAAGVSWYQAGSQA